MKNVNYLKRRIYSFEVRCATEISHGLVNGKGKNAILRSLKNELLDFRSTVGLTGREGSRLWLMCLHTYDKVSRKVWGKRSDSETVYRAIRSVLPDLERFKNVLGKDIEIKSKEAYLTDLLESGIFYLCSSHSNCAKGHKDYQGKIYVAQDWKSRCNSTEMRDQVAAYIKNHHCLTVEEVVGEPVYMVRRPNCKHFFTEISVEEVLHSSVKRMLKRHDMVRNDYNSYEYSEYRKYYERLKLLMGLRDTCPCSSLEKDIRETRRLTKKWLAMVSR